MDVSVNKIIVIARNIKAVMAVDGAIWWMWSLQVAVLKKSFSKMFLQRNTLPYDLATTSVFPERTVPFILISPTLRMMFMCQNINVDKTM